MYHDIVHIDRVWQIFLMYFIHVVDLYIGVDAYRPIIGYMHPLAIQYNFYTFQDQLKGPMKCKCMLTCVDL